MLPGQLVDAVVVDRRQDGTTATLCHLLRTGAAGLIQYLGEPALGALMVTPLPHG